MQLIHLISGFSTNKRYITLWVHYNTVRILIQMWQYDTNCNMYLSAITKSWRWVRKQRHVIRSTAHNLILLSVPLLLLLWLPMLAEPKQRFVIYCTRTFSAIWWEKFICFHWSILWMIAHHSSICIAIYWVSHNDTDKVSMHGDSRVNRYTPNK